MAPQVGLEPTTLRLTAGQCASCSLILKAFLAVQRRHNRCTWGGWLGKLLDNFYHFTGGSEPGANCAFQLPTQQFKPRDLAGKPAEATRHQVDAAMRQCEIAKTEQLLRLRAACRGNSESATIAKLSGQRDESGVFVAHWLVRTWNDISEFTRSATSLRTGFLIMRAGKQRC